MKKRIIAVILLLALALGCMVSCEEEKTEEEKNKAMNTLTNFPLTIDSRTGFDERFDTAISFLLPLASNLKTRINIMFMRVYFYSYTFFTRFYLIFLLLALLHADINGCMCSMLSLFWSVQAALLFPVCLFPRWRADRHASVENRVSLSFLLLRFLQIVGSAFPACCPLMA